MKAIHAFVHFSLVVLKESLLFCDLQGLDIPTTPCVIPAHHCPFKGTLDSKGVMCLIDPQGHTYVILQPYPCPSFAHGFLRAKIHSNVLKVYWNEGKRSIDKFLAEHLPHCKGNNWICDGLGVLDSRVIEDTPPKCVSHKQVPARKPTIPFLTL